MSIEHLLQFFSPYILGDIRNGTFQIATYIRTYWETFAYIGILPFIFALFSLRFTSKQKKIRALWLLICILFLFAFDYNSPIYFILATIPFSLFRIHSRFLAFISFVLIILAGMTVQRLLQLKKRWMGLVFILIILPISFYDVFRFAVSYNPSLPFQEVVKKPILEEIIPPGQLIVSIDAEKSWLTYFYREGWKKPSDYLFFLNSGVPNNTMLFQRPNMEVYSGFFLKKHGTAMNEVHSTIFLNSKKNIASLSGQTVNFFRLVGVSYIVTQKKMTDPFSQFVTAIEGGSLGTFMIYGIPFPKEKYYLAYTVKNIQTVQDFRQVMKQNTILSQFDAFITTNEQFPLSTDIHDKDKGIITSKKTTDTNREFIVTTGSNAFFVTSTFYYPGWIATVDGRQTPLYPANLSGMAFFIPKGTHAVTLQFIPWSVYLGGIITVMSMLFYIFIIIGSFRRYEN